PPVEMRSRVGRRAQALSHNQAAIYRERLSYRARNALYRSDQWSPMLRLISSQFVPSHFSLSMSTELLAILEVGAAPPIHLIVPSEVTNTGPAAIAPVMYDSTVTTWSAISPFVNSVYVSPVVAVEIFWHELVANNNVV